VVAAVLVACAIFASVVAAVIRAPREPVETMAVAINPPAETGSKTVVEELPEMDDPLSPETVAVSPPLTEVPLRVSVTRTRPEKPTELVKPKILEKTTERLIERPYEIPKRQVPKHMVVPVIGRTSSRPERDPRPSPKPKGIMAIVIDDAGNNLKELEPFLKFPGPLTIAVLPGLPHSAEAARRARAAGKEVILHQPMEALGGQNPGPGAISVGMSDAEIRVILKRNVDEVGPVVGMNNHQGSKVTADERTMKVVLEFCRSYGLFFLDSKTTAESVVPAVAARTGISIRERDVFVDNIQERAAMIRYLQEGLQKAEKKGSAVMIGHAWSSELAATLYELYPELVEQGFSLSSIAGIMMGTYDDEGLGD